MSKDIKDVGKGAFKPGKKTILFGIIILIIVISAFIFINIGKGETPVDFKVLSEEEIPQEIRTTIIPEYRDFERALACVVDDKVYVVVTRGEKPTSGFKVAIDSMSLGEDEQGKQVLSVYANFEDPKPGETLSQVLSYPFEVAETSLAELPDKIQLKAQYI